MVFPNVSILFTPSPIEGSLDFLLYKELFAHTIVSLEIFVLLRQQISAFSIFFFLNMHFQLPAYCVSGTLIRWFSRPHKDKCDMARAIKEFIVCWGGGERSWLNLSNRTQWMKAAGLEECAGYPGDLEGEPSDLMVGVRKGFAREGLDF